MDRSQCFLAIMSHLHNLLRRHEVATNGLCWNSICSSKAS